jgi:hypothetical protein
VKRGLVNVGGGFSDSMAYSEVVKRFETAALLEGERATEDGSVHLSDLQFTYVNN